MLFLDLDGTVAGFHEAACRVHGRPSFNPVCWDFFRDWGMTTEQFWGPIHELGEDFYLKFVQPLLWAEKLWEQVKAADDDVSIVSCSSLHPAGYGGKRKWVDKYLGSDVPLMIVSRKHLMADPDRLLIDDADHQVDAFADHGGKTILFPRTWNRNRDLDKHKLDYVSASLSTWAGRKYLQHQFAD